MAERARRDEPFCSTRVVLIPSAMEETMCWERSWRASEDRKAAGTEDDRAHEMKAKRARLIDALRDEAGKAGQEATPVRASAKENVPAE